MRSCAIHKTRPSTSFHVNFGEGIYLKGQGILKVVIRMAIRRVLSELGPRLKDPG